MFCFYSRTAAILTPRQGHVKPEVKRFDMPGFHPRPEYVREMKRYGVLPPTFDAT
jgi:hypothetical protein